MPQSNTEEVVSNKDKLYDCLFVFCSVMNLSSMPARSLLVSSFPQYSCVYVCMCRGGVSWCGPRSLSYY